MAATQGPQSPLLLFPYINGGVPPTAAQIASTSYAPPTLKLYWCPSNYVESNIISYSIPTYMNDAPSSVFGGLPYVTKISQVNRPATTIWFLEEYDNRGYNEGGFEEYQPKNNTWVDIPGLFHFDGCNLSFADGHCEWWHWTDPNTLALTPGAAGAGINNGPNLDLYKLQAFIFGGP